MNPSPLHRLLAGVLAALLGTALLAGCSAPRDLDDAVASQLQTRVAAAKQLATAQDFPAALAELQQLNQEVAAASDQGKVSQERKTRIETAISTIRAELEAAVAPAPQPAPSAPSAPSAPEPNRPLTEDERKQQEEAAKEAEKQLEEAQEEAEKQREEAEKDKGKGKD
ncbi:hypothetical protein CXX84_17255 [Arthrobacter sp. AFG7.2]|uniref:hypothetical protein n=1 Tax=Arthrobacter sp. AFG7.2 TaxID=1688693 RepID=UPI000C9E4E78|nr:hypothetical protein [Arthrobacter sp. AFG7.2]PNI07321.1 hypothetical protein CXX84_17255 [Arthrobacter sp. AFG7.2]